MNSKENIPNFNTIEEARTFWETHSLADFAPELEIADNVQFTNRNKLIISLNLEKEDMKRLQILAQKKGVRITEIITLLVKEQLQNVK